MTLLPKFCLAAVIATVFVSSANGQATAIPDVTLENNVVTIPDCTVLFFERQMVAAERAGILQTRQVEGTTILRKMQCAKLRDGLSRQRLIVATAKAENKTSLLQAERAHDVAKHELRVAEEANVDTPGTIHESEMVRRKLAVSVAELTIAEEAAKLEILRLEEEEVRLELETYSMKSEIAGVVTRVFKSPGDSVSQGENVVEIINTKKIRIEGYVPVRHIHLVKAGQTAEIQIPFGTGTSDLEFRTEGLVTFVDVTAQPVAQVVRVWAQASSDGISIKEGFKAVLKIDVSHKRKAAAEPTAAIRPTDSP